MENLIYADELKQIIRDDIDIDGRNFAIIRQHIDEMPRVDAVSKDLFEQYKWERDVAIDQLSELGLSLGQKIEGVYLTKEKYEKLIEYKHMYEDLCV